MAHTDPPARNVSEVELLRWPADAARREQLATRQVPRLLLVEAHTTPPTIQVDEDWIRTPADERDLWARMQRLALRHRERRRRPRLHDGVVLEYRGRTVIVSEGDGEMLALLLESFGRLVRWEHLIAGLWPDGSGTTKLAVSRVSRLRARIAGVGLAVENIRGRGVVLDHGEPLSAAEPAGASEESS